MQIDTDNLRKEIERFYNEASKGQPDVSKLLQDRIRIEYCIVDAVERLNSIYVGK